MMTMFIGDLVASKQRLHPFQPVHLEDDGRAAQAPPGCGSRAEPCLEAGGVENRNHGIAGFDVHAEGMGRNSALAQRRLQQKFEIGRVFFHQHHAGNAAHAVGVAFQRLAVGRNGVYPLAAEEKKVGRAHVGGKGQPEARGGARSIRKLEGTGKFQRLAAGNACFTKMCVVGGGIARLQHNSGKAVLAAAEAEGTVARHESIARRRVLLAGFTRGNAQRLQIGAIGEEDAGIGGSEGMARIRRDGEAQRAEPGAGGGQRADRQNEMVEQAGGGKRILAGHGPFLLESTEPMCLFSRADARARGRIIPRILKTISTASAFNSVADCSKERFRSKE